MTRPLFGKDKASNPVYMIFQFSFRVVINYASDVGKIVPETCDKTLGSGQVETSECFVHLRGDKQFSGHIIIKLEVNQSNNANEK